ncbi:hypothetical protein WJX75_009029 [Coccomyxa subellipsoidea]|uniref:CW-type domain-containing protein n=1 Tax=Coccomyxa subellipsoidea TaxID=248742 RepID=A0ABR2Z4X6_9CHLO
MGHRKSKFEEHDDDQKGHSWVQCDACNKWRAIDEKELSQIEARGDAWQCSQLFQGASCRMRDDWKLHTRPKELTITERKRREIAEERDSAHEAKSKRDTKRAKRAVERAQGVSAAERHVPGETVQLDVGQLIEEETPKKRRGRGKRQAWTGPDGPSEADATWASEAHDARLSHWEECTQCSTWVELGMEAADNAGRPCPSCGEQVHRKRYDELESWVQCDACGKWRSIARCLLREVEGSPSWTCAQLRSGASCKSSAGDWASAVRRGAAAQRIAERAHSAPLELSARFAQAPDQALPGQVHHWELHSVAVSSQLLDYIPGRDALVSAPEMAAGLDAHDSSSGEHVLWAAVLPSSALDLARPFVLRALQLYQEGRLPESTDGRLSAGPVDIAAFLAQPHIKEAVKQALHRRKARVGGGNSPEAAPDEPCAKDSEASKCHALMLSHVVHVSPDSRKIYIGEECDVTRNGGSIMGFCKSWRSLPIRSWSGGVKMADMPGSQPPRAVQSTLSALLAPEEPGLVAAAEALWDIFAAHTATAEAAARMLQRKVLCPLQAATALGRTAWNAYSFNLDYRTGKHLDGKNTAGSYSALVVCETGAAPFAGGFYMLPQYHKALDMRQGLVLFHRSGDKGVGTHGNSGLWLPDRDSHRIALISLVYMLFRHMKSPLV